MIRTATFIAIYIEYGISEMLMNGQINNVLMPSKILNRKHCLAVAACIPPAYFRIVRNDKIQKHISKRFLFNKEINISTKVGMIVYIIE